MSRIKIKDLPEDEKVSRKEMKKILGGSVKLGLVISSCSLTTEGDQPTNDTSVNSFSWGVS